MLHESNFTSIHLLEVEIIQSTILNTLKYKWIQIPLTFVLSVFNVQLSCIKALDININQT